MFEFFKAFLFGVVEGITEWLPVSSTGHMILLDEFVKLKVSEEFFEMFQVVIQLGAILAVLVLFFHKLNPFSPKKGGIEKKQTWQLWFKVVVAVIPSAALGLVLGVVMLLVSGSFPQMETMDLLWRAVYCVAWEVGLIAAACLTVNTVIALRFDRRGNERKKKVKSRYHLPRQVFLPGFCHGVAFG